MTAQFKLFFTELKLFARDPSVLVISVGLPMLLLVAGGVATGDSAPAPGGVDPIDVVMPMTVASVLAIMGFATYPPLLAMTRERGLLRRMAVTPVSPVRLLAAQLLVHLLAAAAGMLLLFVVARVAFDASPPAAPAAFVAAWLLGALALFALGLVVAALAPTTRATNAVGIAVAFPMLFVAGAVRPRELMGGTVARIGDFTPLAPVVRALRDTWAGDGLSLATVATLAALSVAGLAVAARWFRWQ